MYDDYANFLTSNPKAFNGKKFPSEQQQPFFKLMDPAGGPSQPHFQTQTQGGLGFINQTETKQMEDLTED